MKTGIHLGYIKHSVRRGTIIEHDQDNNRLIIDGQAFDCVKDLQILLRNPDWIEKYSPEAAEKEQNAALVEDKQKTEDTEAKTPKSKVMEVIRSDSDTHKEIDISYTKKQKANTGIKEVSNDMEIIKADESPEERIANKVAKKPAMPIVQAEDNGFGNVEQGATTLNKGMVKTLTAEEHAKLREEGLKKAEKGFIDERVAAQLKSLAKTIPAPKATETPVKAKRGRKPKTVA
jgi:hypothetical protein